MPYPLTGSPLSAPTTARTVVTSATLTPTRTTAGLTGAPRASGLTVFPTAAVTAVGVPPTSGQIWPRSASPGTQGPAGPIGLTGPGVPPGGTINQILAKTSATDYATTWATPPVVNKISVAASAPPAPATNDLWVDTS